MSDNAVLFNRARVAGVGMDDHGVLDVGALTYFDSLIVCPEDGRKPDGAVLGQAHASNEVCCGGYEC